MPYKLKDLDFKVWKHASITGELKKTSLIGEKKQMMAVLVSNHASKYAHLTKWKAKKLQKYTYKWLSKSCLNFKYDKIWFKNQRKQKQIFPRQQRKNQSL
jgi:hypothetical protein